jgi:soluble lytic murein transglycosylase-like protein/tetratricopeptide (TPR) repeat protein
MGWLALLRLCTPAPLLPARQLLARAAVGLAVVLTTGSCGDSQPPASGERRDAVRVADGSRTAPAAQRVDPKLLKDLFTSLRSSNASPEAQALLSGAPQVSRADPDWPTLTYLVGEVQRRRGETERARKTFRELASWAASGHPAGPYNDTWGGSGLATIGLWRWLQMLEPRAAEGSAEIKSEIDQVLQVASALAETRLYSGMMRSGLLPALPLVEEDVARRLAHVAWKSKRPQAAALFLDFLSIDSSGRLDPTDNEILGQVRSLVTPERLKLFRARRLLGFVKTDEQKSEAASTLETLLKDGKAPADVRAEAGYEWANFNRRKQSLRPQLVEVLTSTLELAGGDGPVAEKALHLRGRVYNLEPKPLKDLFRADMNEQLRRFPQGRLADDALFQLASDYLFAPDASNALLYFERLRNFPGLNEYQDSAYFLAALALVGRNDKGDLDTADKLLAEYVQRYPDGVFRLRCLFWRGRIAERRSDAEMAGRLFRQVIDEAPYDYYGLRARMHLEDGAGAIEKDLPGPDSRVRPELREAYRQSKVDTEFAGPSPYHVRLQTAVGSGLYTELLKVESELTERLDDVPLDRADERGLLPGAALLLALRQDALAARDSDLSAGNRLRLAGALGRQVRDWPVALSMTALPAKGPRQRLADLQKDPRYLATFYASADHLRMPEHLLARAAWPIDGSPGLSQSLMYAVMRRESGFYPGAISSVGALGLFQFLPSTFSQLDKLRGGLLQKSGVQSDVQYLLDPERNMMLWAWWMKTEFKLSRRNQIVTTVMNHHAGGIAGSISYWSRLGLAGDVEYHVETVRFTETRNFVRLVLQDTTIVDAAGLFEGQPGR